MVDYRLSLLQSASVVEGLVSVVVEGYSLVVLADCSNRHYYPVSGLPVAVAVVAGEEREHFPKSSKLELLPRRLMAEREILPTHLALGREVDPKRLKPEQQGRPNRLMVVPARPSRSMLVVELINDQVLASERRMRLLTSPSIRSRFRRWWWCCSGSVSTEVTF